jgi:hypothetical protein
MVFTTRAWTTIAVRRVVTFTLYPVIVINANLGHEPRVDFQSRLWILLD